MEGVQTTQVEPPPPGGVQQTGDASDAVAEFMSVVLADTEDTWTALFAEAAPIRAAHAGAVR